ncbi:MAG: exodeoxyribonuclease VII large subunit, partial [Myxococcota bacterium]
SVLDEVGHPFKTPTAVGQFLVERVGSFLGALDEQQERLRLAAELVLNRERAQLQFVAHTIARETRHSLDIDRRDLWHCAEQLDQRVGGRLRDGLRRLDTLRERLPEATERRLGRASRRLDTMLQERLSPQRVLQATRRQTTELTVTQQRLERAVDRRLKAHAERVEELEARRRILDPRRVLGRGFALVRSAEGALVQRAHDTTPGQPIHLVFVDGELRANVLGKPAEDES